MTVVLWFTGLSGSGKTTLANHLIEYFKWAEKSFVVFDGDEVRSRFHKHLGFSKEDITENNRLIIKLCLEHYGKVDFILVPIISPFRLSREEARRTFGKDFVEIFLSCSFEECKKRDVKGLYKKAENGEIENFIGLHIPYEPPENPEIIIYSANEPPEDSIKKIINFLEGN